MSHEPINASTHMHPEACSGTRRVHAAKMQPSLTASSSQADATRNNHDVPQQHSQSLVEAFQRFAAAPEDVGPSGLRLDRHGLKCALSAVAGFRPTKADLELLTPQHAGPVELHEFLVIAEVCASSAGSGQSCGFGFGPYLQ